jgi:putative ABC transport system permease protein
MLSDILIRLRALFRRNAVDSELREELRFHFDHQVERFIQSGLPLREARRNAGLIFGGAEQIKEECRDARGIHIIETLAQDVRYTFRMLRKSPGFTAVVIMTLALGIGANTALFGILDAVLLRPLPFKNSDRLVDMTEYSPRKVDSAGVSFPDYLVWKQENTVFEETAAYFLVRASNDVVLGGPFSAERARYSTVTNSFFAILGVQPEIGRGFTASDERPGGAKVFLASDALWHRIFGGDPQAIGKTYLLDGENYILVGVMPRGFDFPKACGIWVPTGTLGEQGVHDRISHPFHVLGRLRPGTNLSQAEAQIEGIQERLGKTYPKTDADWRVRAQPLLDEVVGNVRASLFVLAGAVGFILLIACTNVVNLMLARLSAREQEFAIRAALGAGRMRLLRQNLTEALVIVAASVGLALLLAQWGLTLLVSLVQLPRMESFHLSLPILLFMTAVAALTTIFVGLAPALQASRQEAQGTLRRGQRGGTGDTRNQRLRNALVVSEVAVALLLLCGAGLSLRSFLQLNSVNPGFQPQHLVTMKIALPSAEYPKAEQTSAYLDRLLERLQALPGVKDAAATTMLPMSGESDWASFQIVGDPIEDWAHAPTTEGRAISANYFRTLGIPLLRGRPFIPADAQNKNTVIINEAMAKKFWPGKDPIGQFIMDLGSNAREIIGIVADVKSAGLDSQSTPEMYTLYSGWWYIYLVLRTSEDPASVIPAVRAEVAALDKGVPVYQVATMDQLLNNSISPQRFNLFVLALFAALALVLAAVGIYGVLAFTVNRRRHEIGIRLALGAQQQQVLRLILWGGMKLVLAGLAIGVIASIALTRLMSSLLFQVSSTDPATLAAVAVVLALIALLACYIPARRAMRVDPTIALRCE